jgi:hypothetical protein
MEVVRDAPAWTRWRWRWRGIEAGVEEERRRRLELVVAVAEASPHTSVAAMTGRTVRFLSTMTVGEAPVWIRR